MARASTARKTRDTGPPAQGVEEPGSANLPTQDKDRLDKTKDEIGTIFQRPSTGRTTAMGRRVEKPGTGRQSGPSGQTDAAQHDKKHANK